MRILLMSYGTKINIQGCVNASRSTFAVLKINSSQTPPPPEYQRKSCGEMPLQTQYFLYSFFD